MREHEVTYSCTPKESVTRTVQGPICSFCGTINPDSSHLEQHNASDCSGRCYTRKGKLAGHLETDHGVPRGSIESKQLPTELLEQLANQFKHTTTRRYFACGFCVDHCSGSLNEQLRHVDRHYKSMKPINDWDDNKVIKSLLSHSLYRDHWRGEMASVSNFQESWCSWNATSAKALICRLETGSESPDVLCKAALEESNYRRGPDARRGSLLVQGSSDPARYTNASNKQFQRPYPLSQVPDTAERDSAFYGSPMSAPTPSPQHLAFAQYATHNPWSSPQTASGMRVSSANTMHSYTDHRMQSNFSPNVDQDFAQGRYPAIMFLSTSAGGASPALEGQPESQYDLELSHHSPGASFNTAIPSHPLAMPQADARWNNLIMTAPSTVSPSVSDCKAASLGHSSNAYSPGHHRNLTAHPPIPATVAHNEVDMTINSNNQRYLPHDQNYHPRQRWNH